MNSSQLQRLKPRRRPRHLVSVDCLRQVLLRKASGPEPEKKLAVAMICQAIEDCRIDSRAAPKPSKERFGSTASEARYQAVVQHQAIRFMQGEALDAWASAFELDARFIRELAIKTGYWQEPWEAQWDEQWKVVRAGPGQAEPTTSASAIATTNASSQERKINVGLQ